MPTMGKRGVSCLTDLSLNKPEVFFVAFLPFNRVLEGVTEDNFVNLRALLVRVGEDFSRLLPLLSGFVFFFIRTDISAIQLICQKHFRHIFAGEINRQPRSPRIFNPQ